MVKAALEAAPGFVAVTSTARDKARKHLDGSERFNVVVADIGASGDARLQIIPQVHASRPRLPVIIYTAHGSDEIAAEAMKLGAVDYLVKSRERIATLPIAIREILAHEAAPPENQYGQREMEQFFTQARDLFFVLDRDGVVRKMNPAAEEALARLGATATPASILDWIHETDVAVLRQELAEGAARKGYFQCVSRTKREGDVDSWWTWSGTWSPEAERFFAVVRETTGFKTIEDAHRDAGVALAMFLALSPREQRVLTEVATGMPNKAIARHLDLSEKTVERHRSQGMRKLRLKTVADLVRLVIIKDSVEPRKQASPSSIVR